MEIAKVSLQEIYDGLKGYRGAIKKVAQRADCNIEWVRLVLKGKYTDNNLVVIAAQVWAEEAQALTDKTNEAQAFINQARQAQQIVTA